MGENVLDDHLDNDNLDDGNLDNGNPVDDDVTTILSAAREQIDALDRVLLDSLDARLDVCRRVAEMKHSRGIPMMQPDRVKHVVSRAEQFARDHSQDPDFFAGFFSSIVDEACRIETDVINRLQR